MKTVSDINGWASAPGPSSALCGHRTLHSLASRCLDPGLVLAGPGSARGIELSTKFCEISQFLEKAPKWVSPPEFGMFSITTVGRFSWHRSLWLPVND